MTTQAQNIDYVYVPSSHEEGRSSASSPVSLERANPDKGRRGTPVSPILQTITLALLIVICLGAGTTAAFFTAEDDVIHFTPDEQIRLSLSETWDPKNGINYQSGITVEKEPTIISDEGTVYARVRMRVEEPIINPDGSTSRQPITDPARLNLILGIFYSDSQNKLQPGRAYSLAELGSIAEISPLYNPIAFFPPSNPEVGTYYFEHQGALSEGSQATLFNKVVIPLDYSTEDIKQMGDFIVSIEGQAIQSFEFASQTEAMTELDSLLTPCSRPHGFLARIEDFPLLLIGMLASFLSGLLLVILLLKYRSEREERS